MENIKTEKTKTASFCNTLSTELNLAKNSAYTPTFKLAFDIFINEIGADYIIKDKNLQQLNSYRFTEAPLKEDEYQKEINKKGKELKVNVSFNKELPFEIPSKISESSLIFEGSKICNFKPRRRPELIYYKNKDDFAISLIPADETQEIILTKSSFPPKATFESVFQAVNQNATSTSLDFNAEIKIPIIELDWSTEHPEIKNRKLEKSNRDYWNITEVKEDLKFNLTNSGAKVQAYHKLEGQWNCVVPEKPHQIIFDKPFMIFLKKQDASTPYLAAYIADSTFLREFDLTDIKKENNSLFGELI